MVLCRPRFPHLAAQLMLAIGSTVVAAGALAAPVVVTPGNLQGWNLFDGNANSPATITGTQPDAGNGSVQLTVNAGDQAPSVGHSLTGGITFSQLVASPASFGFSWLVPVGAPLNSSPTIRLLLSGLSGAGQTGRTDGSVGWFMNTDATTNGTWQTSTFSASSGNFFFRVGGKGQETDACTSTGTSFDDRRQTLATWAATCNGIGGTADIDDAIITGIEVDWGTFPGNTTTQSVFTDLINFNIGSNVGDANFEVSAAASAVPEPESMALMLLGLGLTLGATVRGRRGRRTRASNPAH